MESPDELTGLLRKFQGEMRGAVSSLGEIGFNRAVEEGLAYLASPEFCRPDAQLLQALISYLRPRYGTHSRAVGVVVLARWLEVRG